MAKKGVRTKKVEASRWVSRIVGHDKVAASKLMANPFNHRLHPKNQRDVVSASIRELGFIKSVIVNRLTGHIVDGHERVRQALDEGPDTPVDVEYIELSEEQERKALFVLDASSELADVDGDALASLFADMKLEDAALRGLMDDMAKDADIFVEPVIDEDDVPEVPTDPVTKPGDLWILGNHRVLCGDSTKAEDVGRLMDGAKAHLVITDPPYGVSYSDKNAFLSAINKGNGNQTKIENDHLNKKETQAMWGSAFKNMADAMGAGAVVYCFMPQGGDQMMMMMMMMMMEGGIEPRHELIWLKNNHVLGRSDYNYKHEPILYAWKKGGHKFYGDFSTSVIECKKPHASKLHPTMKPVELVAILVQNSSQLSETIYDPFMGSGTTLIAAEQLNRKCYGIEISPVYVDVICSRWSKLTGRQPIRESDGKTFMEISNA